MMNDEFSALPVEISKPLQPVVISEEFEFPALKAGKTGQPHHKDIRRKLIMLAASSVTALAAAGMIFAGPAKSSQWETAGAALLADAQTVVLSRESQGEGWIRSLDTISGDQETEIAYDYTMAKCQKDNIGIILSILPAEENDLESESIRVVFCGSGQDSIIVEDKDGSILSRRLVSGQLDDNAWHHAVLKLHQQKLSVYVDGSFVLTEELPELGIEQKLALQGSCPSMVSDLTLNQTLVSLSGPYLSSEMTLDLETFLQGHKRFVSMGRAPIAAFQTTEVSGPEPQPEDLQPEDLQPEEPESFVLGPPIDPEAFTPLEEVVSEQEQSRIKSELNQRMDTYLEEGIADGTVDDSMLYCFVADTGEGMSIIYFSGTWSAKSYSLETVVVEQPNEDQFIVGLLYQAGETTEDGFTPYFYEFYKSQTQEYLGSMSLLYSGSEIFFNNLVYHPGGWI